MVPPISDTSINHRIDGSSHSIALMQGRVGGRSSARVTRRGSRPEREKVARGLLAVVDGKRNATMVAVALGACARSARTGGVHQPV